MLILRSTTKAFKKFGKKPQLIEVDKIENDFGEWYVNTVDWVNQGNLFMAVMHTESLYTMLVLIEKGMDATEFVHAVFANILMRFLRIEVPKNHAEKILKSYDNQAIFAKTKSRSLVASLSSIIKDIEAILEYHPDIADDNVIDLARLEYKVNESPRTLNGQHIWPLKEFYRSIRRLQPVLPSRTPLPFVSISTLPPDILLDSFSSNISEGLALKVKASAIGAEVLFDLKEIHTLIDAICKPSLQPMDRNAKLSADLERMLKFQCQKLEKED